MHKHIRFPFGIILLLATTQLVMGCASMKQGKWLQEHQSALNRAAHSDIPTAEKLDVLAESYTRMMHQTLNFANPKKGLQYARQYNQANQASIAMLLHQIGNWKEKMGALEIITFGLRMAQKPYIKDFMDVFPRFKRKFETYSSIAGTTGDVGKGLLGLGLSQLDKILK